MHTLLSKIALETASTPVVLALINEYVDMEYVPYPLYILYSRR